jgi:hypothetical protein
MVDVKMKGTDYFSGQKVYVEDLSRDSKGLAEEIGDHLRDIVHSTRSSTPPVTLPDDTIMSGIVHDMRDDIHYIDTYGGGHDFALTRSSTYTTRINVGSGLAYDRYGRRIYISSSESVEFNAANPSATPSQSTGNIDIDLTAAGGNGTGTDWNYIYIKWLEVKNTGITAISQVDGTLHYIAREDGYKIIAGIGTSYMPATFLSVDANKDYVYIGAVQANSGSALNTANIRNDVANRQYLGVSGNHIKARTPNTTGDKPTSAEYTQNVIVTLEQHIRAVENPALVTPDNPHGMVVGGTGDHKVMASSGDPTPDYLLGKVDNVTMDIVANKLAIKALGVNTAQIANSAVDSSKIAVDQVKSQHLEAIVTGPPGSSTVKRTHLDNSGSTTYIGALVNGSNADSLHLHAGTLITYGKNAVNTSSNLASGTHSLVSVITPAVSSNDRIYISTLCSTNGGGDGTLHSMYITVDGVAVSDAIPFTGASVMGAVSMSVMATVSSGAHTLTLVFKQNGGSSVTVWRGVINYMIFGHS